MSADNLSAVAARPIAWVRLVLFAMASLYGQSSARAATIYRSDDWTVTLDNSLSYGLGMRAQGIDPAIGNNPVFQNSEYKFPKAGNIVTNRLGILTELDATHGSDYGLRVSVAGWNDFAYDNDKVKTNPGLYAPGLPYAALSGSPSGRYGSYTHRFYATGAELEDALVFGNFNAGSVPVNVKLGRFTEYWGNALFAGAQAISYSQSPIDGIKATSAPGTQLKELFLPRGQLSVNAQVTDEISLGVQYHFEWRRGRFPEGGTYLGALDPSFFGPQALEGKIPRGADHQPRNLAGDFGLRLVWNSQALNATIGLHFRQFDETNPYSPGFSRIGPTGFPTDYGLSYAHNVHLYGLSVDKVIGNVSNGLEVSYRQGTALNSTTYAPVPDGSTQGARGDTINVIENILYGLPPTPLYQTGTLIAEIAYTQLLKVTSNPGLFYGVGYSSCLGGKGKRADGCSTQSNISATIAFDPQWLQVLPGLDIDMPVTVGFGIHGNGQYLGSNATGNDEGSVLYSVGVNTNFRQRYQVKLAYNGYSSAAGHLMARNGLGSEYYGTGVGNFFWNDKSWLSLVFQAQF